MHWDVEVFRVCLKDGDYWCSIIIGQLDFLTSFLKQPLNGNIKTI